MFTLTLNELFTILTGTSTCFQLFSFFLSPKNIYGVVTSCCTFLSMKHCPAVYVIILQSFWTNSIGSTDIPGKTTWYYIFIHYLLYLRSTDFGTCFLVQAIIVTAFTLERKKKYEHNFKRIWDVFNSREIKINILRAKLYFFIVFVVISIVVLCDAIV